MKILASLVARRRPSFSSIQRQTRGYQIAIVGSGPSGCYTAKYLLSALRKRDANKNESNANDRHHQIDIIDRLPTPYGLVRYGVAPDHPEVKNVQNDFDTFFEASSDQKNRKQTHQPWRFWGNVQLGRDLQIEQLRKHYDAVVLAYGCEGDRQLSIPGSDLKGVLGAREFVAWYNGHPEYQHIGELVESALRRTTNPDDSDENGSGGNGGVRDAHVVVIGQGNVALDCARVLAKGADGLFGTDLAAQTLQVLQQGVKKVSVVGRRGHVQGAFTIKEVRELVKLAQEGHETSFVVSADELDMGATEASMAELEGAGGRPKKRIDKLLRQSCLGEADNRLAKRVDLRFLLSPVRFEADSDNSDRLGAVIFERTKLEGEPGQQRAVGKGDNESIEAQLALVSIGYKGLSVPGLEPWFDRDTGVVRHEHGRVDMAKGDLGGLYTSGWLKRGPSGIIGTNIGDAKDTVATILKDLDKAKPIAFDLGKFLKEAGLNYVDWDGYQRIVAAENGSKRSENQPREKLTSFDELLEAATCK